MNATCLGDEIKLVQYIPQTSPFLSVSKVNWMTDFQVFQRAFTVNCFGEYGKKHQETIPPQKKKQTQPKKTPTYFNSYLF